MKSSSSTPSGHAHKTLLTVCWYKHSKLNYLFYAMYMQLKKGIFYDHLWLKVHYVGLM